MQNVTVTYILRTAEVADEFCNRTGKYLIFCRWTSHCCREYLQNPPTIYVIILSIQSFIKLAQNIFYVPIHSLMLWCMVLQGLAHALFDNNELTKAIRPKKTYFRTIIEKCSYSLITIIIKIIKLHAILIHLIHSLSLIIHAITRMHWYMDMSCTHHCKRIKCIQFPLYMPKNDLIVACENR